MEKKVPVTIDAYISACPAEVQPILQQLHRAIAEAAPEAGEKISWGMPTFTYHGNLVHFAAEKRHIGFHPAPTAIEAFQAELTPYSTSKGTVRLPLDQPLPLDLLQRMVRFRVAEQARLAEEKRAEAKAKARVQRPRYEMPEDLAQSLAREQLTAAYEARPPYQRNDYIAWLNRAKREDTREKRLRQILEELHAGDMYMGAAYRLQRTGENSEK